MSDPVNPAADAPPEPIQLDAASLFGQVASRRMSATVKGAVLGVTSDMLRQHLNRKAPVTADELRAITEATAREILYQQFWKPLGGDNHPDLAAAVFDIAVRRGAVDEGIKLIQKAIPLVEKSEIKIDGRLGRQTLTAIESLKKAGKDIALLDMIDARRRTLKFRIGDGKLFGADIDGASAASLVLRFVAKRII